VTRGGAGGGGGAGGPPTGPKPRAPLAGLFLVTIFLAAQKKVTARRGLSDKGKLKIHKTYSAKPSKSP
jgi:hypothetical protein